MKLSKLFFLMLLAVATISCSSDDDGADPYLLTKASLAGNYEIELLTSRIEQTFTVNNVPIVSVTEVVGGTFKVNTTFFADGTFTSVGDYHIVMTVTTNGQTETSTDIINVDESGTYVIGQGGNTITLMQNGDSQTHDVKTFNETRLNLQRNSTDPIADVPTLATYDIHLVRK